MNQSFDKNVALRKYQSEHPELVRGMDVRNWNIKKWQQNNKDKTSANYKVYYHKKKGVIIKQNCIICNSNKSQAHHADYTKPLDVIWLCPKHHMQEHMNIRNKTIACAKI